MKLEATDLKGWHYKEDIHFRNLGILDLFPLMNIPRELRGISPEETVARMLMGTTFTLVANTLKQIDFRGMIDFKEKHFFIDEVTCHSHGCNRIYEFSARHESSKPAGIQLLDERLRAYEAKWKAIANDS